MEAKKRGLIISGILVIVVLCAIIYVTFFTSQECKDFECFQNEMRKCAKANYIDEQPEATWKYEVLGKEAGECRINVKLLQAKEGELGVEGLQGMDMDCYYKEGFSDYPQKDLTKCHGRLKEELQGKIIEKLHAYILKNVGEISSELRSF